MSFQLHYHTICACAGSQGMLASLQPFFVKRTRHFLNQALMFADRITHFLWASILLSAYFGRSRRLEEAFVVISPAARLASACGLDRLFDANGTNEETGLYLLPPPRNVGEMVDRLRLAHSIYITDQTLYILSGYPTTFKYDGRWGSPQEKNSTTPDRERTATENDALAEVWHSDMHLKVSIARIFERKSLPPLSDPRGLQPSEAVSTFNPHLILAHTTLYGSGLILWSLRAHEDIQAKDKLLECLQALWMFPCR
ncbi:hypothetical protein DL93DRAFT_1293109 [Clavulina sp. PMI_390]|nr:hypothetical protein DL93DRAFT_1293109 [Clavulina sp. PMI_390]